MKNPLVKNNGLTGSKMFLFVVAMLVTMLDIALVERKFQIFSGGFLQVDQIVTLAGRIRFIGTILLLEIALAACCWYAIHLIGSLRGVPARTSRYQFLFLYGGGSIVVMIVKYKIASYFGDFLSLAVLRNLGGGSLQGAILYALNEGVVILCGTVVTVMICWACYRRLTKIHPAEAPAPQITGAVRVGLAARIALSLAVLGLLAFAIQQNAAMRRQLKTITPYSIANEVSRVWRKPELSTLARLSATTKALDHERGYSVSFPGKKDNLVLVVSESTRADVLIAHIGDRPVTPNWNMIAAEGGSAAKYYSHTGFTSSSLKAICKGSLDATSASSSADTLFATLKRNDYQIVVISGQDESFGDISTVCGSQQSADVFFDARSARNDRVFSSGASGSLALSNERVMQQFDAIAAKIDWNRPIFLYVNFQAAHFPYHHKGMPKLFDIAPVERADISFVDREKLKLTYLNAVASSDKSTGQLVARLKMLGVYDRSLVAVTGDHGESLFEDGILGHGIRLTDTQLHTLLIANRHLPAFDGLIGQTDLAKVLLQGIGASLDGSAVAGKPSIIQYVGDLDEPTELGYVYPDGQRFRLNNADGELHASWLQRDVKVSGLAVDSREYKELIRLIAEWRGIIKK